MKYQRLPINFYLSLFVDDFLEDKINTYIILDTWYNVLASRNIFRSLFSQSIDMHVYYIAMYVSAAIILGNV